MNKKFEELEINLNEYLKNNGVLEIPTDNKEKLKLLKRIYFNSKVEIDVNDLKHSKDVKNGVNDPTYIDRIQNLEVNAYNSLYYISCVSGIVREEKRMKRIAKIKSFLKIK